MAVETLKFERYEFGAQCKDLHVNMNGMGCWRKMQQRWKKSCAYKTKLGHIKSLSSKRPTHEEQSIDSLFNNTSVSHSKCVDGKKKFSHGFFFIKEFEYLLNQIPINEVGQHFVPNVWECAQPFCAQVL